MTQDPIFSEDLEFIDYDSNWYEKLITFIDQGYKELGYTGLELESLDNDLQNIEALYSKPSCFKLLIDKKKLSLIATLAVKVNAEKNEAELKRVFVSKDQQSKGLGKTLSLWAFDYCKDLKIKTINIWSGTLCKTAHKFYQKLGAQDQKTQRELGGVDQVVEYLFTKRVTI